jgi:hypothetical protein
MWRGSVQQKGVKLTTSKASIRTESHPYLVEIRADGILHDRLGEP